MELSESLRQHFGYDAFRKGQEAIVRSVLSGRPTIAILPPAEARASAISCRRCCSKAPRWCLARWWP